jgi:diguanylate cyclase (GGDEF)-like protein
MPLNDLKLLFVEDDKDTQKYIKMLLEDEVKELYQAYDGREGLELFNTHQPDIVVTDINLPHINGLELAKEIKTIQQTQAIIVMSAHDDRENILNSINIGSSGFITKPIDVDLLFQRLNAIAETIQQSKQEKKETHTKINELYNLAHYDSLTKIPNMLMFEKELDDFIEIATKEKRFFSILFIDLDNFKYINDTYGHDAGDYVLKTIANHISTAILHDDIVARRSGDEFLVLLRNYTTKDDIKHIAYNILQKISKDILWGSERIKAACSIGISRFPDNAKTKNELLTLADTAMYNAKALGKGKYFFADDNKEFVPLKQNEVKVILNDKLFWHKKHKELLYENREIPLTKKEHMFLSLLFSTTNKQVSYEQIYFSLWGNEYLDKKENVKTLVKTLRKKLPEDFIENIFGMGYKIRKS